MTAKFSLNRQERLKSRKSIDALFKQGSSFVVSPIRVLWLPAKEKLQFGAGVSAKNFKKAIDRNTIKRRIREAYRLQNKALKETLLDHNEALHIFFTYTAKEIADYHTISAAVQKGLDKLVKIINEKGTAGT